MLDAVRDELGRSATIVVSSGEAYLVDADRKLVSELGWSVDYIEYVPSQQFFVVGNGLWFESVGAAGAFWRTRRVSWDGMRSIRLDGAKIVGEAYAPIGPPDWLPFEVNLISGHVEGGSYDGPP